MNMYELYTWQHEPASVDAAKLETACAVKAPDAKSQTLDLTCTPKESSVLVSVGVCACVRVCVCVCVCVYIYIYIHIHIYIHT